MKHSPSHDTSQNHFQVQDLRNNQFYLTTSSQIFQKFQGSTNMSVRELIFQDQ